MIFHYQVILYLDDILVTGVSKKDCQEKVDYVVRILKQLGFLINMDKSSLEAQQKFIYLGFVWDTTRWFVSLKLEQEHQKVGSADHCRGACNVLACLKDH